MPLTGIVIVACGHPYYGRMAYNLCLSIKSCEKETQVCVLYNGAAMNHMSAEQLDMFDYIIRMDESIPANQASKLYAYIYTPFENTVVLDADMLWLPKKKPSELFEEVKDCVFTGITEGKDSDPSSHYFFWANVEEIREVYQTQNEVYQWRTEVMCFNEAGKEVLKLALEVCKDPKLKSVKMFAEAVPDELGVNVATSVLNVKPHQYRWQPSFWHLLNKQVIPEPRTLHENYFLISFGSNFASGTIKKYYDTLMRAYCNKMQKQHVFSLFSKRDFLPNTRKKM